MHELKEPGEKGYEITIRLLTDEGQFSFTPRLASS